MSVIPLFDEGIIAKPGSKAKELIKRSSKCFSSRDLTDRVFSEYKGSIIKDIDGNIFLNFIDSTNPLGGGHPNIIQAVEEQLKKLIHISGAIALHEPYIKLAETLKEVLPYNDEENIKIAYCVTGTEACDYGIKLARFHTKRPIIFSHIGAFHGRTGTTLGVTTSRSELRKHSSPLISETVYLPYPNCYRCVFGQEYPECNMLCIEYIETIFKTVAHPYDVAGVILEPIQMHGGVVLPPDEYLPVLKKTFSQHGILLIVDEVYTGFCKTGKFFAIENFRVEPDILCMGKGMGGGMPIAAISANKAVIDPWELPYRGSLGSFAGHPLSAVAALENIRILKDEKIMEDAIKKGEYITKALNDISAENGLIGDVRGMGLIIGVELVEDRDTKTPATEKAGRVVELAFKKGLLVGRSGSHGNVIKITPSLTIRMEQIDKGLDILNEALKEVVL